MYSLALIDEYRRQWYERTVCLAIRKLNLNLTILLEAFVSNNQKIINDINKSMVFGWKIVFHLQSRQCLEHRVQFWVLRLKGTLIQRRTSQNRYWNVLEPWKHPTCLRARTHQSCPTLCNSVDCSPPGTSVHGILQARILERIAMPFPRGSFWPRNQASRGLLKVLGMLSF